jgi:hypothetical protein
MSELPFLSALGQRFSDFLAFRRVGGIDSKSDRALLRYFDRFLAQQGFGVDGSAKPRIVGG